MVCALLFLFCFSFFAFIFKNDAIQNKSAASAHPHESRRIEGRSMTIQSEHNVAFPDPPAPPAPGESPPSTPPETPPSAPPEVPQPDPSPQPGDAPPPRAASDFTIRFRLRQRGVIIRRHKIALNSPDHCSS
jgi:hypothetical protein